MIHARTLQALDFSQVTEHLAALCCSDVGRTRARALAPLPDATAVTEAARLYEEFRHWTAAPHAGSTAFCLGAFPDVSGLLAAAQPEHVRRFHPDTDAFWALREVLRLARDAHTAIAVPDAAQRWPHLLALAEAAPLPVQLTAALLRCLADDGLLRDESSPELYRLRGELRRLHQRCLHRVKDFAAQYNMLAWLQDEFMTLSSDRYVLPLKANAKGRMQGIIHDWSQTGETCYFEPMFLVEINNRLQELKREEREEERKILAYLRDLLLAELPGARAALELLARLDVLQASGRLADSYEGRMLPLTPESEGICLREARHPLLLLGSPLQDAATAHDRRAVRPLDIVLRPGERTLIITGGNAGGKTVCLKTLGLITAMTCSGLPVPVAPGSHMPWCQRMDAFIGDEQSLTDHVSTFTAQIEHLGKAWKHLDDHGLLLLDEFGAGTDPAEGAALAQAVLDGLLEKRTFVLAATHFPALKSYALTHDGVRAASMLFDPQTRQPLFKLAYDQVGSSLALDVARRHGLPETVLQRAQHYLLQDGQDATALLARLNELAARREEELTQLQAAQQQAQRESAALRQRLEEERRRLQEEIRGRATELMRAWKEGKATHKQALKEMSRLRASLLPDSSTATEPAQTPVSLTPGEEVEHTAFHKRGRILDVDQRRQRVRLDMDGVRLWASFKDVRAGQPARPVPPAGTATLRGSLSHAAFSLDLRGLRADVALNEVERFLDRAILAGHAEVEIVHGRGTGVLRRQIHDFLRSCPAVASFALAPEDRGGDGMTIVHVR